MTERRAGRCLMWGVQSRERGKKPHCLEIAPVVFSFLFSFFFFYFQSASSVGWKLIMLHSKFHWRYCQFGSKMWNDKKISVIVVVLLFGRLVGCVCVCVCFHFSGIGEVKLLEQFLSSQNLAQLITQYNHRQILDQAIQLKTIHLMSVADVSLSQAKTNKTNIQTKKNIINVPSKIKTQEKITKKQNKKPSFFKSQWSWSGVWVLFVCLFGEGGVGRGLSFVCFACWWIFWGPADIAWWFSKARMCVGYFLCVCFHITTLKVYMNFGIFDARTWSLQTTKTEQKSKPKNPEQTSQEK